MNEYRYDLLTHDALVKLQKVKQDSANNERDQNSYNAAWKHGYAAALFDLIQLLETPKQ